LAQKSGAKNMPLVKAFGGAGVVTGNVPLVLGAIASSPKVIVPMILRYGSKVKALEADVNSLIKKLQSGEKLASTEKTFVRKAIEDTAQVLGTGTALEISNEAKKEP
jgi:hypothetical protein